jgi:hypothetical protein
MFSITRLPFFLYYPVVNFDGDSPYYYMNVDQIDKGMWPAFIIRTPGYPLFIKFVFLFFNKNISLIAIQNIFSLLTSLFFIYVIHKVYSSRFKFLPLLASIGMGAFISGSIHLISDTSFMTESLYVNFLVLFFALFILAIHSKTKITWILCSICMAAVILIRPSALFFILVSFIIMFFLFINSYKKAVFLFAVPFIVILFLTSLYNYITIGSFSVTTFTENALISITSTFLEKNEKYAPGVNEAIEKCQNRVKPAHKNVMENSWNYKELSRVLKKYYNRSRKLVFSILIKHEKEDSFGLYMKWRPILRKIALNSILIRPKIYIKYIYSNLVTIFFNSMGDVDFYHILKRRYLKALNYKKYFTLSILDWDTLRYKAHPLQLYSKKEYGSTVTKDFPKSFLKEYWDPEIFSKIKIKKVKRRREAWMVPTFLQRVHQGFKVVHEFIFRNNFWIFIFFFTFIFSLLKLWRSRFHHKEAFILFIMTLSALLHGVVVATSAAPILRLIFPMQFVYYLSLFLLPIIIDFDSKWFSKIKGVITQFFPRFS